MLYSTGATWTTKLGLFGAQRLTMLLNIDNVTNRRYWNSVQTGTYGIGMDRTAKFTLKMDI